MPKKIICMIPARIGSERFKKKNLALIQNKPVLSWGIEAAIKANIFDEIIVNGDSDEFKQISKSYGLKYFSRNCSLASSESKSDDVVFNFLEHYECDYIAWFNAIAPLQTSEDINGFIKALVSGSYDSLFSIKSEFVQANFKEQPLNFSLKGKFSKTQDLEPIKLFVPSLMGWDSKTFRKNYLKNKFSFFNGNVGYYEIKSKLSALVIKNEQDFKLIRSVIEGFTNYNKKVEYYMQT